MAPVPFSTLRQRVSETITHLYYSGTNTGTSSSAVTDANLALYDATRLKGLWVLITSGNRDGQARQIASVTGSTATLYSALSGALANGDTFEILAEEPALMEDAIHRGIRDSWPTQTRRGLRGLFRAVTEHIVVDNLLDNPFFNESESTGAITAFASYDSTVENTTLVTDAGHGLSTGDIITISGTTNYNGLWEIVVVSTSTFWIRTPFIADDATGTWVEGDVSQEGTASGWTATSGTWTFPSDPRGISGANGRKVARAAGAATLTQDIFLKLNIHDATDKTLHVRGSLLSATASIGRLRVSFDGGSTFAASTSYHAGGGDWEGFNTHQIDVAIPSGATTATIYCDVASGGNARFRLVVAWVDPVTEYPMPVILRGRGINKLDYQVYGDKPEGAYVPVNGRRPYAGALLRLHGVARLSVPTVETGAIEVDDSDAELIIRIAASHLYRSLKDIPTAEYWEGKADEARMQYGHLFPSADEHTWWSLSDDRTTLYLGR